MHSVMSVRKLSDGYEDKFMEDASVRNGIDGAMRIKKVSELS